MRIKRINPRIVPNLLIGGFVTLLFGGFGTLIFFVGQHDSKQAEQKNNAHDAITISDLGSTYTFTSSQSASIEKGDLTYHFDFAVGKLTVESSEHQLSTVTLNSLDGSRLKNTQAELCMAANTLQDNIPKLEQDDTDLNKNLAYARAYAQFNCRL